MIIMKGLTMIRLLCIFCTLLTATAAHALQCAPHDTIVGALAKSYGEIVRLQAMTSDGRMMEITVNPVSGTWSAMLTTPDGNTCLVAGGDSAKIILPGDPA